jgi:hypothetical protein
VEPRTETTSHRLLSPFAAACGQQQSPPSPSIASPRRSTATPPLAPLGVLHALFERYTFAASKTTPADASFVPCNAMPTPPPTSNDASTFNSKRAPSTRPCKASTLAIDTLSSPPTSSHSPTLDNVDHRSNLKHKNFGNTLRFNSTPLISLKSHCSTIRSTKALLAALAPSSQAHVVAPPIPAAPIVSPAMPATVPSSSDMSSTMRAPTCRHQPRPSSCVRSSFPLTT